MEYVRPVHPEGLSCLHQQITSLSNLTAPRITAVPLGGRRMIWRRIVCALIGHDYTVFFRCLRCDGAGE